MFKSEENCPQNTKTMRKYYGDGEQTNGEKKLKKRNRR